MRPVIRSIHVNGRLGWVVAAIVLIVMGVGLKVTADRADDKLYKSIVASCHRGDALRAGYAILASEFKRYHPESRVTLLHFDTAVCRSIRHP